MKKTLRILLSAALVLCMAFAAVGCGDDGEKPDREPPAPVKYEVTVVNGKLSNGYNHDYVTEGTTVTVTADPSADFEQGFTAWKDGPDIVSTEATYTFAVSKAVTLMAEYGSNYSVWDGQYPETAPAGYVVDEANKQVHIQSAAALAYWANFVTNAVDGNDKTNHIFSTYDFGQNAAGHPELAPKPDNKWTINIDCNIDLAGEEWTPIMCQSYTLNDVVIDGHNHVVKNFYTKAFNSGEYTNGSMKAAGFIGNLASSSLTIQNWTFDNAVSEVVGAAVNFQNVGIVIGYAHGNTHAQFLNEPQLTKFDNVNVINSKIIGSSVTRKAGLLLGRLGTAGENYAEKQHCVITNCTLSNNLIAAQDYIGAMVGHMYSNDADITVRDQTVYDIYNNIITGFTAVSFRKNAAATAIAGTVGVWNMYHTKDVAENGTTTDVGATSANFAVNAENNNPEVIRIELFNGRSSTDASSEDYIGVNNNADGALFSEMNTNANILLKTLTYKKDEATEYFVKDIFVVGDITLNANQISVLEDEEWVKGGQTIYLVAGATLNADGVDFGDFRYINGDRDENGNLIVYSDAEGKTRIGVWKVTDGTGAYVADGAANS